MRIPCPHCGERFVNEFTYKGAADPKRPGPDVPHDDPAWMDYVYLRDNPIGPHREYWLHNAGCRRLLVVTRDTLTHAISGAVDVAQKETAR